MANGLNDDQKIAVEYKGNKPLLIEAGPGSGKTFVLIERVKFLLKEGCDPESFLVITFTIKAAEELKKRLAKEDIPKEVIDKMQISTIHSFCFKLLGDKIKGLKVYDDDLGEMKLMFLRKNRKELGFTGFYYFPNSYLKDVLKKYEEYTMFNVDIPSLIDYIKENHQISDEYYDYIKESYDEKGHFPRKEIDGDLKDSWHNARYLRIAESYMKYLEILAEENIIDFSLVEVRTLEYLRENPKTQYTNVLVDEFQDSDPIQIEIFRILLKEALERGGSFAVVGDVDQSIYGFRGAVKDYFEDFAEKYGPKIVSLKTNYRSVNNVISLSESFIKEQRGPSSRKSLVGDRDIDKSSFYLTSLSKEEEASNIAQIIKKLKDDNKIKDYSDVAVLYRSVKSASKPLIEELETLGIPYQVKGLIDYEEQDEVKSIVTLLNFIANDPTNNVVPMRPDLASFKNFTGEEFEPVLFNLSSKTKTILNNVQEEYQNKVEEINKVVAKEFGIRARKNFNTVFNHDEEVLEEIFNRVEVPTLSDDNLIKYGVTDEEDLEFFRKLNELKDEINKIPPYYKLEEDEELFEEVKEEFDGEIPTIIEFYYKLLSICGIISEDFVNTNKNNDKISNLAVITNTMFNYENVISKYDFKGLFWYLIGNLKSYEASANRNAGVHITTIHKSKGLEYPVTIIASLQEPKGRNKGFPNKYKSPLENKFDNGYVYYTPNDCLEYKKGISLEAEERAHNSEEKRVIYVGMTRAEDILILSSIIGDGRNIPEVIQNLIDRNPEYIKELDMTNLAVIDSIEDYELKPKEKDKLTLSYSSMSTYLLCPMKYKLQYNFSFKTSAQEGLTLGSLAHEVLENINLIVIDRLKDSETRNPKELITKEEILEIIDSLYVDNPSIEDIIKDKTETIENVFTYWEEYGDKIIPLESEYGFNVEKDDYIFKGFIDLLYETPDGELGIIDYKNSEGRGNNYYYTYQLYSYIVALSEDPKYKNREVKHINIYLIKGQELLSFNIQENRIESRRKLIGDAAEAILNDDFHQKISPSCEWCDFNVMCGGDKKIDEV